MLIMFINNCLYLFYYSDFKIFINKNNKKRIRKNVEKPQPPKLLTQSTHIIISI